MLAGALPWLSDSAVLCTADRGLLHYDARYSFAVEAVPGEAPA
jgi:hypothetical protein